jgi:hypothetical protein
MQMRRFNLHPGKKREFEFIPRIINPIKISHAAIFSADEQVRKATEPLQENMPWVKIEVLRNPQAASNYKSPGASVLMFDDVALNIVDIEKIQSNNKDVVLVLLSSNPVIHCSAPAPAREKFPYVVKADLVFAINRSEFAPEKILPSVVRCAEDKLNIEKYSQARRFIFLVVDDEPRWFSQFLPLLYNIIGQRADVMVSRTYEEALQFLFGVEDESEIYGKNYHLQGHGDDVVCVITDIYFPKGDNLSSEAGRALCHVIKNYYPRIPLIIASKAKEGDDLKDFAFIMPKGDIGSLDILKNYIHDFTGMGNFLIQNERGDINYRVKDIHDLYEVLLKAEEETSTAQELRNLLEKYGRKDYFSTWLYMHGFREIGDKLRPRQDRGQRLVTTLKRYIIREILRMNYTPLVIDGMKIFTLRDLLKTLHTIEPEKIQNFSDNDYFSIWLDRKGYSELAEEFRPIHGSGIKLEKKLAEVVEKWISIYKARGRRV